MDVSPLGDAHPWELSDSSGDAASRTGFVNAPESPAAGPNRSESAVELALAGLALDVDVDPLSFNGDASHRARRDPSIADEDDSVSGSEDSASGSSSSATLFAAFLRDPACLRDNRSDPDDDDEHADDADHCGTVPSSSCGELPAPHAPRPSRTTSSSSSKAVFTSLKKSWKKVKKSGVRGKASAGKSLSSLSSSYFAVSRLDAGRETWEERHSRMGDEWLTSIIPAWRKKKHTARVRTLVFRGIPANVRGKAWQCAIGNPLNVSEELFEVLKERAYAGRMEYIRGSETVALADGDVGGNGGKAEGMLEHERSAHKAIMLDLPRTFPELSFFHAEGSHYEYALRDILEAFLYLKPDVGYSQGMSFLAAVLLLYMDPYDAFSCFVNMLLHKSCFLHFFKIKMPEVRFYLTVHERLLSEEMPSLHSHFQRQGIESDLYMINWVMSLYCRALPLDLVTRIWDLYVLDGDVAIFRAALGILRLFMSRLMKMNFEDIAYFLSHIPAEEIQADALLQSIRSVRVVTRKRFRDLFREIGLAHSKTTDKATVSDEA